jgi:hypothetical protein
METAYYTFFGSAASAAPWHTKQEQIALVSCPNFVQCAQSCSTTNKLYSELGKFQFFFDKRKLTRIMWPHQT